MKTTIRIAATETATVQFVRVVSRHHHHRNCSPNGRCAIG